MTVERIEIDCSPPGDPKSTVWVGLGVLADAGRLLQSRSGRWLVVASRNAAAVASRIKDAVGGEVLLDLEIADSEREKTLDAVRAIVDRALEAGVRRDDAFVAVGGGVVTDVVGFAAAVVLRGVRWFAVPTTIAGMADAAIGGKTGVDHALGKNLIGALHPPAAVLVDPSAAATLADRDYRSGLVEAFKAAWVRDAALAARGERELAAILRREPEPLLALLSGAVRVKADVVSSDPTERGPRRLLNFGHTAGHAFEAAGGYRELTHGEAVAWGIAAALDVSQRRAGLASDDAARIRALLRTLGPFPDPVRSPDVLAPLLSRDKKASSAGVAGVLLEHVGRGRVEEGMPPAEWVEAAVHARLD